MVALNATVSGNFEDSLNWPQIFFEGYLGYSWAFPKSRTTANVGIGWAGEERPNDYLAAFRAAADRNSFPVPDRDQIRIDTIPRGPSLNPELAAFPDDGVYLVGDAAGIANRYQGEGICQAIRSAYCLAALIDQGVPETYPEELYSLQRPEYRLAHLIRGVLIEHEESRVVASLVGALDGITVHEITRSPLEVAKQLLRYPTVVARLFANRGMLRRLRRCYTDNWEYKDC